MVYEIDYDLRGEAGERREDYTVLEERINLLGDALRIEYSSWLVEVSAGLPMVEAYLKRTLRFDDRLLVAPAANIMAGQGFSDEQRWWLSSHGIQILGPTFAFTMIDRFEAELRRKKQRRYALAAAAAAATLRRAFAPAVASTPIGPSVRSAIEAIVNPKPPPTDWTGALGIGSPPSTLGSTFFGLGIPPRTP
jgi:hypothetical protein